MNMLQAKRIIAARMVSLIQSEIDIGGYLGEANGNEKDEDRLTRALEQLMAEFERRAQNAPV